MIKEQSSLPAILPDTPENIKILSAKRHYKNEARFFVQDQKTVISLLDGDCVLSYDNTDKKELSEFFSFLSPRSVYGDYGVLSALFGDCEKFVLLRREKAAQDLCEKFVLDDLDSREIYKLLSVKEFSLPPYEYFAPDYCRRKNRGGLKVFAKKDFCAALGILEGNALLLTGVVSHKSGGGTLALKGLFATADFEVCFAAAREDTVGFYLKNGFEVCGSVGIKNF